MPVIQKETTVAAGEFVENVLTGSAFEFARSNSLVSMGVVQSAEGGFVTIQSGSDIVLEETTPVVKDGFPIIPDEMYYNDVAAQGDRLVVRVRNAGASPLVFRTIVQITAI
jgi:hypothetical protein